MSFIGYEKERSKKGEISVSTIPNYYRATKLFCEMNDIVLNWKKIARGLPRPKWLIASTSFKIGFNSCKAKY
jgi:hypothetical protein